MVSLKCPIFRRCIGTEAKDAEIVPSEEDQRMPETYFELDANAGNDVQ